MLKTVTPAQAVTHELLIAEHDLLRAETGVEYASALVTYNKNRVKRLRAYLANTEEVKETI
jgi:predicted nucleic acid-binding protein